MLRAADYCVTDDAIEIHLVRDVEGEPDQDHATLTVRVVTEHATAWGHEQYVELLDVEGDPDGTAEWLLAHEGEVVAQWNWRPMMEGGALWN